ncbi:DUF2489 domain-containing protein [Mucilaginibacter sp. SG564]|uniref:DUF2489 domain-containing protein n=1 Tax=unclassified Mucilaginibacter TaxID=2617802 RepID=UPI001554E4E5|nr:DUF2489 domain-containing protein [Mucilaginibacter sp. SG564]NOW97242.1 flagellar basal body-associated protein FliL [Mucilaginibacter sp. SG564]
MEPVMMFVITAIIAAILLVVFNKQQESKVSNHLYTNEVQKIYLLAAAEYKINMLEENQQQLNNITTELGIATPNISAELNLLTTALESGEIPLNELNLRLDHLLDTVNIHSSSMVQAF